MSGSTAMGWIHAQGPFDRFKGVQLPGELAGERVNKGVAPIKLGQDRLRLLLFLAGQRQVVVFPVLCKRERGGGAAVASREG